MALSGTLIQNPKEASPIRRTYEKQGCEEQLCSK
jgi:hypothetical protein